jgi:hypothetical protein
MANWEWPPAYLLGCCNRKAAPALRAFYFYGDLTW